MQNRAIVTAAAHDSHGLMLDRLNRPIVSTIECSTDVPEEALGDVAASALRKAWMTGIDPALEKDFRIVITFS